MNNLLMITGAISLSGCMASPCIQAKKPASPQKPNILIIYTDDMGIGDLSCYNSGKTQTPNIDRLASQGIQFDRYYSSAPVSSPSRVGLTTGMYPLEWGIHTYLQPKKGNAEWKQNNFLDDKAPSMARALREAGYTTAHIGKWHMGGGRDVDNAPQITAYGFDEYLSTWESPDPDPKITASDWIWCNDDQIKRWDRTNYFVNKTLDFLSRNRDKPCFVNFWPDDMHTPWVSGPGTQDKEETWETPENFNEVLAEYDRQIGQLLDGLQKLGLEENTLVIFTSDNGPAPSFKQMRTNELRGVKCSLYEGGINMPMIVRWPGHIAGGQRDTKSVICAVDFFPSLCALTGAKIPSGYTYSGENMLGALTGTPADRKGDLMWEYGMGKTPSNPNIYNKSPHLAIRRGDMKLIMNGDGTKTELYDLKADPKETVNVADKHTKLVKELSAKLIAWWNKCPAPTH